MITTTIIAVKKETIVFILPGNMKDISFHEYTPAGLKKQKSPLLTSPQRGRNPGTALAF
jgi:hypothetical protein